MVVHSCLWMLNHHSTAAVRTLLQNSLNSNDVNSHFAVWLFPHTGIWYVVSTCWFERVLDSFHWWISQLSTRRWRRRAGITKTYLVKLLLVSIWKFLIIESRLLTMIDSAFEERIGCSSESPRNAHHEGCLRKRLSSRSCGSHQKTVSFDSIEILEFPAVLGDNPAVSISMRR